MTTLAEHLTALYPGHNIAGLAVRVRQAMGLPAEPSDAAPHAGPPAWSQDDVVLITYADSLRSPDEPPLQTLGRFVDSTLDDVVTVVHVLPFFPSSGDGGFSVVDFESVEPSHGTWSDITALAAGGNRVMADLVLNHISASSLWFQQFIADEPPGRDYFVTADPSTDLSQVVRPRTHPLLRPTETAAGPRHVWATFSHDQIDVDFANPDVLVEFVRFVALFLAKGVSVIRLDAIGYLWKRLGTTCIHLEETHRVVKVLRMLLEEAAPEALLITETNVPHAENVSYFGSAGVGETEAHLVYNFTLPPLVLHGLLNATSEPLVSWATDLAPLRPGTSFFNFLASHDGIGVRPAEGLLTDEQVDDLANAVQRHGGRVSYYSSASGERPYELNTSLFDALATTADGENGATQIDRFCAAHAIMLAFVGMPALYVHSFLATPNDMAGVAATDHNRDINRSKLDRAAVEAALADHGSASQEVLTRLTHLTRLRRAHPAFHPEAGQQVLPVGDHVLGLRRTAADGSVVDAYVNLTPAVAQVAVVGDWHDLVAGTSGSGPIDLAPYGVAWLRAAGAEDSVGS